MTEQKNKVEKMSSGRRKPRVRISLVERDGLPFLRIEYEDYAPIAKELEKRGLQKYYSTRLWGGNYSGFVYRYVNNEKIIEGKYSLKISRDFAITIRVIDDINERVIWFDENSEDVIVNVAIFRVEPRKEGDVYVTEVPITAQYVPFVKKFFQSLVKLYRSYLLYFIPIKKVRFNVEFW